MATRLVAYVDDDLAGLVDRTADALGQSRAALLRDVLTASAPMLEVMGDLARELDSAPGRQREALRTFAGELRALLGSGAVVLDEVERAGAGDPPPLTGGSE